jgi:hypothetical protein
VTGRATGPAAPPPAQPDRGLHPRRTGVLRPARAPARPVARAHPDAIARARETATGSIAHRRATTTKPSGRARARPGAARDQPAAPRRTGSRHRRAARRRRRHGSAPP